MPRIPTHKELNHTRLANGYGGWIYCGNCGKSIGYLCYVTYDCFRFSYQCNCGGQGSIHIAFGDVGSAKTDSSQLTTIKNRKCCPKDQSPLVTVLEKNLTDYQFEVVCKQCNTKYREEQTR